MSDDKESSESREREHKRRNACQAEMLRTAFRRSEHRAHIEAQLSAGDEPESPPASDSLPPHRRS
jgi:hypothetical protein